MFISLYQEQFERAMLSKFYSFVHGFTVGTSHKQVKWKFKTLSKVPYMLHLFNVNFPYMLHLFNVNFIIKKYKRKKETKKERNKEKKRKNT